MGYVECSPGVYAMAQWVMRGFCKSSVVPYEYDVPIAFEMMNDAAEVLPRRVG